VTLSLSKVLKDSVAITNSAVFPGSLAEWPASYTICKYNLEKGLEKGKEYKNLLILG
jgi:hypothetical protein